MFNLLFFLQLLKQRPLNERHTPSAFQLAEDDLTKLLYCVFMGLSVRVNLNLKHFFISTENIIF